MFGNYCSISLKQFSNFTLSKPNCFLFFINSYLNVIEREGRPFLQQIARLAECTLQRPHSALGRIDPLGSV